MAHPVHIPAAGSNLVYPPLEDGSACVSVVEVFLRLTGDDCQFHAVMFFSSYSLGLLHKHCSKALEMPLKLPGFTQTFIDSGSYLMLELGWIPAVHRHGCAVDMQFPHDTASTFGTFLPHELRPECSLVRALAQPQETDQDVSLGVFVRKERFPASVCGVIPSQQFDTLWPDLVVYLVDLRNQNETRLSCVSGHEPGTI